MSLFMSKCHFVRNLLSRLISYSIENSLASLSIFDTYYICTKSLFKYAFTAINVVYKHESFSHSILCVWHDFPYKSEISGG